MIEVRREASSSGASGNIELTGKECEEALWGTGSGQGSFPFLFVYGNVQFYCT